MERPDFIKPTTSCLWCYKPMEYKSFTVIVDSSREPYIEVNYECINKKCLHIKRAGENANLIIEYSGSHMENYKRYLDNKKKKEQKIDPLDMEILSNMKWE